MPNHVATIIEAPKHVIDSLRNGSKLVDFNTVLPMPSEDDPMFTATRIDLGFTYGYSTGGFSPMDWAVNNWWTKWNAYDVERLKDGTVKFNTAWSHPEPVIVALSEKFPDEIIQVAFADEDMGHNLGGYLIKNGESTSLITLVEGTEEAVDYASWVRYGMSWEDFKIECGWDD